MRNLLTTALALAMGLAGAPAAQAQIQADFEQLITTSGATNGAAQVCGAAPPDLARHKATARANLQRYATEFGYQADRFDALFEQGRHDGETMMLDMRKSGVDGCAGMMGSFQHERDIGYDEMKQGVAEITDGLPEPQDP
ncbi:hypothetical protein [Bordetella sp. BOR01]|uniref:hypothetical protein n=1 Tax=Bordetella sp. BOR01 TaxID=2854779 RepID=UPI002105A39A|nr:hypothetical protein [Bordetella sp. BOR01]